LTTTPPPGAEPEDERLSAAVRVNLTPAELARLQAIATAEDRPVAGVIRRAVREMFMRMDVPPVGAAGQAQEVTTT
jgi:hypothetical protein